MTSGATASEVLAPIDVARLEEGRLAKILVDVALEHEPFAGGVCGFGGLDSWQNVAFGAGLSGPVAAEEIDRFCAFHRSRGVEPRIELSPLAHESLVRGLAERGFVVQSFQNVFYRALRPDDDYRALLPGLTGGWPRDEAGAPLEIRRVDVHEEAALRLFTEVAGSGFRPEGAAVTDDELATFRRSFRTPYAEAYLAYLGERPVAGGSLETHGSHGALIGVSTLPAYRRRGVQLALFAHRLERARSLGCRIASVGSKPGVATERNAARMGFHVAYTKVVLRQPALTEPAAP